MSDLSPAEAETLKGRALAATRAFVRIALVRTIEPFDTAPACTLILPRFYTIGFEFAAKTAGCTVGILLSSLLVEEYTARDTNDLSAIDALAEEAMRVDTEITDARARFVKRRVTLRRDVAERVCIASQAAACSESAYVSAAIARLTGLIGRRDRRLGFSLRPVRFDQAATGSAEEAAFLGAELAVVALRGVQQATRRVARDLVMPSYLYEVVKASSTTLHMREREAASLILGMWPRIDRDWWIAVAAVCAEAIEPWRRDSAMHRVRRVRIPASVALAGRRAAERLAVSESSFFVGVLHAVTADFDGREVSKH